MCLGTIRCFLLSFAAFPANSNNSAVKYSNTLAIYTGAPAPTRVANPPLFIIYYNLIIMFYYYFILLIKITYLLI